jgi:hypothetical protein|tara:strand:+ start:13281 stop:13802 length:522 start_codon:yes stop_codon:yes gene_type:complete
MKKLYILLASLFLLASCAESIALLGPITGASNGKLIQSSLNSAVSYGVKKQTGKTPMQHALAYAEEKNPNKKKEKCISFIEKTNSEVCMIAKKQITLAKSNLSKKISSTQTNIKKTAQVVVNKSIEVTREAGKLKKSKKSTKEFFMVLKTKIKEYDERWLDRIEKSKTRLSYQ